MCEFCLKLQKPRAVYFQSLEMVFLKLCEEDKEGTPDLTDNNTQVSLLVLGWFQLA